MLLPDFDGFRDDFLPEDWRKRRAIEDVGEVVSHALCKLQMIVGPGCELVIVKTKLQEAAMWARQAIETRLETSHGEQATPLTPEKK